MPSDGPNPMATDAKPTYAGRGRARPAADAQAVRALWLPAAALFVGLIALYWLTATRCNTFDAVSYADQIGRLYPRTGDRHWLFHPHHIFFNATGYVLWRLARALGYAGGPLPVLQRLNAVLGAAGATVFYLTLRRLMQRSRWLPFLVALGLSVSFGYWICASDGRVNMPSIALLIGAFAVLCRLLERGTPTRALALGGLSGVAVLYHESTGLFFLVGLAGVLLAPRDPLLLPGAARRRRGEMLAAYAGAWAATVCVPYLLVGTLGLGLHSVAAFRHWMTTYSELGWWWNFHIPHNLRLDANALRSAAFHEPPGHRGTFTLARRVPAPMRVLYWTTLAGWLVAVWAFFRALPLLWRLHHRPLLIVCVLWIALYAAFFTVWNPGYEVFWVPVLVPISTLLSLVAAHYRARRGGLLVNWLVGVWIALAATLNAVASIGPHLHRSSDPFQRAAADVRAHTRPGDLIVVAGAGDLGQAEVDIPYFAGRDVVSLHTSLARAHDDKTRAWGTIQSAIDQTLASGHDVYAFTDFVFNTHTWSDLRRHHPSLVRDDLQAPSAPGHVFAPYDRSLAWEGIPGHGPMWRLTPKAGR